MTERDGYQPGVPCWVAAVQPEPERAVSFYSELFGWAVEDLMPPGSQGRYFLCKLRGRDVAAIVSPHGAPPPPGPTWATYVWVDSADAAAERAAAAGGSVVGAPFDSPGGGRVAVLADPSGAVFGVWQPGERRGAQVVNEPGAWSMSLLSGADPERAKAFYGDLFGWVTETFALGEAEMTLWRVPGYVGGEPQQPVSREVVAAMAPASDGPPRWSVDFWVADADGAAGRAAALGGEVLAGPYDVPGFRQAALADPHGATLTVSQLVGP